MASKVRHILTAKWLPEDDLQKSFLIFAVIVGLSIFAAIISEWYFLAGIPAFFLLVYVTVVDFRKIFFLLLAFIPLSTEVTFSNGFGTDLPTEPLMVGLMLVWILYQLANGKRLKSEFFRHPITLILMLHFAWTIITTVQSQLFLVSFKFLLAKTWYIAVFYFLAGLMLKTEKDIRTFFWVIFIPLMLTVLITLVRHSAYGFSFEFVYRVLSPYQRNHVNYAATLSSFVPFVWLAYGWYKKRSLKWWVITGSAVVLIIAVYLSYTRAAYIALIIAAAAYFIIRLRLMKWALAGVTIACIVGLAFFVKNNRYLEFAPNYETTTSHKRFDNLMEATYKGEDISTMERVYRWVAGFHMTKASPVTGYGPGNFVNFYEGYTVTSFQTYVSENKERSGIHSYFLLMLVEQGIVGFLIFTFLSFYVLIKGEKIYHQSVNPNRKKIVMAFLLCTIVIDAFLIINDLVETDKSGPYIFMTMAVLVNLDLLNRRDKKKLNKLA